MRVHIQACKGMKRKMRVANVASVKDDRKWGKRKDEMASE